MLLGAKGRLYYEIYKKYVKLWRGQPRKTCSKVINKKRSGKENKINKELVIDRKAWKSFKKNRLIYACVENRYVESKLMTITPSLSCLWSLKRKSRSIIY